MTLEMRKEQITSLYAVFLFSFFLFFVVNFLYPQSLIYVGVGVQRKVRSTDFPPVASLQHRVTKI